MENGSRHHDALLRFYLRRALRIFPLFYAVLFVAAWLDAPGAREGFAWHATYLTNFLMFSTQQWTGTTSHFWSLAVEEQFYFVWPLVMLFTPRRLLPFVVVGAILSALIFKIAVQVLYPHLTFIRGLPVSCLDMLGLGALLAIASDGRCFVSPAQLRALGFYMGLPMLALALVLYPAPLAQVFREIILDISIGLVCLWLVAGAAKGFGGVAGKLLEQRAVIYVGVISYGIYVIHNFMPHALVRLRAHGLPIFPRVVDVILLIGATVLLAVLSWTFYERPINKLKQFVPYAR